MSWTDYHAKLAAYELTRKFPIDSENRLASVLVDAQVDLNPHQIDAALFAFNSPFNKGAILADEVGLGKTIEAGIIISQKWAERKRKILIILPSNLRKQWQEELAEKFFLPSIILETKTWKELKKAGIARPFVSNSIVLCSYQFARNKANEIKSVDWDLVVFDEAHRLRNVYKPSNIIANTLKQTLNDYPKILLTATPLQNSLLEFFGLVSIIDEHVFGDIKSFKEQFVNAPGPAALHTLKNRIAPFCKRTLRKQVLPYIRYTRRLPLLEPFTPEESEDRLYNLVSTYLQRPNLQALPTGQRTLITLIVRKLLASSSFAIAGTLEVMIRRLEAKIAHSDHEYDDAAMAADVEADYEGFEETFDERSSEEWDDQINEEPLDNDQIEAIKQEIADLQSYKELAVGITENAKGKALLIALEKGFAEAERLGAARKAVIFTESRRTQEYLLRILSTSPWGDKLLLFNGSNTDERSKVIYEAWAVKHEGTDRITGSKSADMRSALVDYFRHEGMIMIATEAGAEGINLQFCSLVVNYDLPWNPQRIEQRIGRCHRYGQEHDVVVVNFLNEKNEADQRVYQLLSEKFRLFDGVFGSSDEILGSIESGVDFEKRIADIYQNCRKTEDIQAAFDALQLEMSEDIDSSLKKARTELIENFDDEVREKLRLYSSSAQDYRSRFENLLMDITRHELAGDAEFLSDYSFTLRRRPFEGDYPLGLYELPRRSGEAHLYRLGHPLAMAVINSAKTRELQPAVIEFDLTNHEGRISILEEYQGQSGFLIAAMLTVKALEQDEEYFLFAGTTRSGKALDDEAIKRLFTLYGKVLSEPPAPEETGIAGLLDQKEKAVLDRVSRRNADYFEKEADKLDGWAEDLKLGLEREIKDIDKQIKETRRLSVSALTLEEKLRHQKEIRNLEAARNTKRKALFDTQDDIDRHRDRLIEDIEAKLKVEYNRETLFEVEWRVV
ncbi:DEAD/DEAH box helicase [Treponema sp. TIM-1]|uniref:SNF2-related protein n=1 Tax=Treponema sp. TIM-1 TaxID=2898417 RepID=UPI0039814F11